jgi:Xaa-Pro aminopeptidase
MDIGGGKDGYSSDITRMAVIGSPPEGYAEIHAVVEAAVQAAMFAAKPGVKAHVVDDAARRVITQAGYGEYFMHRTGHGMGVEIHETPYISASSQTILKEGMVFSIEPGIYLPNRFGIRLEDIVILRADGPEILSNLPRDVKIING